MVIFTNEQKMTVTYSNVYGRSSKLAIEKSIANLVEVNTGKPLKSWVQKQYDLLCSNPKMLAKYCRIMKFDEDIPTPRKYGSIIRLMSQVEAYRDIPDSEL